MWLHAHQRLYIFKSMFVRWSQEGGRLPEFITFICTAAETMNVCSVPSTPASYSVRLSLWSWTQDRPSGLSVFVVFLSTFTQVGY